MHEDVKRFSIEGEVAYRYLTKTRESLQRSIEEKMRMDGYVPILDIDPQLTQAYDPEGEKFRVSISLYGAWVGDKECEIAGLMYGKPVKRYTPKTKLNQSSTS